MWDTMQQLRNRPQTQAKSPPGVLCLAATTALVTWLMALLLVPASGDDSPLQMRRGYRTSNYTYLGCYYDRLDSRDLPTAGRLSGSPDAAACHVECAGRGFRFFGLQHGSECWCGHVYGGYGSAEESDCSMPCERNASQVCGGTRRNSVFEARQPRYIGCYRHKSVARDSGDADGSSSGSGGGSGSGGSGSGNGGGSSSGSGSRDRLPLSVDSGLRASGGSGVGGISRFACSWRCAALGYSFFGLRSAGESCLCGTDYGSGVVIASTAASGTDGTGDSGGSGDRDRDRGRGPAANCADSDRTAVYQVIDPGYGFKYIGCYKEKCCQDMNLAFHTRRDMSPEVCYFHCLRVPGALYFGLQDGDECHCSTGYGKFGPREGCDTQCGGNRGQKCGGLQRNSVYQILQQQAAATKDTGDGDSASSS